MIDIEWYVYWVVASGLFFNGWLVWCLARICGHAMYAAVAAVSFTRFCWACGKVHGFRERKLPSWVCAPQVWFEFFIIEFGASKGSISHMGGAGVWNGIGNWTVFPPRADE